MASPSSSGRRGLRPIRKPAAPPLDHDRTRLTRELEEIRVREMELKKEHEKIQRQVEELPRQLEERERKQREMIRMRAVATATIADGFSRPRDKRHAVSKSSSTHRRRTRPEERSARIQLFILIGVFICIFFLLCKSLPR